MFDQSISFNGIYGADNSALSFKTKKGAGKSSLTVWQKRINYFRYVGTNKYDINF